MVFIEKADIQITCSSAGNQRNKGIIFEFFQRTLPAGDCFVSTASDEDIMIAAQCVLRKGFRISKGEVTMAISTRPFSKASMACGVE